MTSICNMLTFLCVIYGLIGIIGIIQCLVGIFLTVIQNDSISLNHLTKTIKYDAYLFYIAIAFIGLGSISLPLTGLSLHSAINRLRSLICPIVLVLIVCLLMNLLASIIAFLYFYIIVPQLKYLMLDTLNNHYYVEAKNTSSLLALSSISSQPYSAIKALDYFQEKYQCCGINSKQDYLSLSSTPRIALPLSCCRKTSVSVLPNSQDCWNQTGDGDGINLDGCYSNIHKFLTIEIWLIIGIALISALLQFLAIILLVNTYRDNKNPKFIINHTNNNHDVNTKSMETIEDTVEITQI
ncbi:unnamed protein product [Didymodactylos carnosus]|uniref:Tetraspanin n=1 Tax=Didymodactylos carnosus TaxID=1234261 RepID=A0A813VSD4_9BILA|nr:unnamed protein product [Didymodactylos carnosus]CAF0845748.1 unnamed protein product [Didymodactylos carnosus]CAF3497446.1 unnamed protein product [Didymodactylos carnosus]CAF3633376.1 unnamed protein product [Didymodactylos carnosus]